MGELGDRIAALTPQQRLRLEERLRRPQAGTGGLGPRPAGAELQLSFGQERIWQLARRTGPSSTYNMHTAFRLRGPLDLARLEMAIRDVVNRHGALRITFEPEDGHPVPGSTDDFNLGVTDLSPIDVGGALSRVGDWAEEPMDLAVGPLFAAHLWILGPNEYIFSMRAHHLVCDGWSLGIIESQLSTAYAAGEVQSASLEYADFVAWERSREPILRAGLEPWRAIIDGASPLQLPGGRDGSGGELRFELSADASAATESLADRFRSSPFTVLLAAFSIALSRLTGKQDLVICTPVAGRSDPALEGIVGYFNDIVPIRVRLEDGLSLGTVLERMRESVLQSMEGPVPFQWIAAQARGAALTRGLFALNDVPRTGLALAGMSVEPLAVAGGSSDFELGWFMRHEDGRYRGTVRHKAATNGPIADLIDRFIAAVDKITGDPEAKISGFPAPTAPGRRSDPEYGAVSLSTSLVESRVHRIWERLFGRSLAADDDFFDLGGESLLAAELIAEVEKEFGLERMPLSALFQAPTVARFARLLEGEGQEDRWESLVPIKPTGDRPPLFFVHAHGGNVIGYADLARNLSPHQPLYGLQSPRGDLGVRRLEDMAKTYIDEIRTVQSAGPYLLGGWCLGGDVAFEMAQQLRRSGAEVALVLMVDNPRPEHISSYSPSTLGRLVSRLTTRLEMEWSNLAEVPRHERGVFLKHRIVRFARLVFAAAERSVTRRNGALPFGLRHSQLFRQEQVASVHQKAYATYEPEPYDGVVALFRAERQPRGRATDTALGWSPYVSGKLIRQVLPGHRIGLLSEPRIKEGARIIEGVIAQALAEDEPL